MTPRRFVLSLTVPSTLLEDDEAFQFFCRGYWEEMLERAGGTPADDPMVRAFLADDQFPESALIHMVQVHVIGYSQPPVEVRVEADNQASRQIEAAARYWTETYGRVDPAVYADAGMAYNGGFGGGGAGGVAGGGATVWLTPGEIIVQGGGGGAGSASVRGRMYDEEYVPSRPTYGDYPDTIPQQESWGDSMTFDSEDGGDIFL